MAITFAELKTAARERADMTDSEFVTDSELTFYINSSIAELHDILIQSFGEDYKVKEDTFTTTSGTDTYSLSTIITDDDFYKLRGVDVKLDGNKFASVDKFNFNERNRFQDFIGWSYLGLPHIRYRLVGNDLKFHPVPDNNTEVKVWYIPIAQKLSADTDTLDDVNQFAEYVIVDAAIKMLNKEESDVTVLMNQKMALKRRIEEVANNRDAGESESITDIYSENDSYYYGRTRG